MLDRSYIHTPRLVCTERIPTGGDAGELDGQGEEPEYFELPEPPKHEENPYMPGHLRNCWSEWEKLKPNSFVRSIILRGYRLQWRDRAPPPPITRTNSAKVYEHHEIITKKVHEVKQSGVVRTCRKEDLICILSIIVLPKPKSDKLLLIIDGSPLKPYELRRRFKLEQI